MENRGSEEMRYLRRYKGENNWEEISREEMVEKLGRYYRNSEDIVSKMEKAVEYLAGGEYPIINTPWTYFRIEK